jgi:DNA-binding transcriptional MerR regulator
MDRYSISDLERLTGIMAGTIRIWERRYRIIKPHRTETNRRWYDNDDLKRVLNIATLYRKGIKISTIATFSGPEILEKVKLLTKDSADTATQIDSLIVAMSDLDEDALNNIITLSVRSRGFEETFTGILFPFLRRVGIMWHTGSTDVASEHFVTGIFRRRLIAEIESFLKSPKPSERKKFLMYLPEDELHELGLLFYTYLARRAGHNVLYLGQSTPFTDLLNVVRQWHPDFIVTGALTGLPFSDPGEYLRRISTAFKDQKILVSGLLARNATNLSLDNVIAVDTESAFMNHL